MLNTYLFRKLWPAFILIVFHVAVASNNQDAERYLTIANEIHRSNTSEDPKLFTQEIYFLKKAVKLNEKNLAAWNNLGDAYESIKEYDNALECYLNAIKLKPDAAITYFGAGDVHFWMGRYEKAIEYYEKGLSFCDDPSETATTKERLKSAHFFVDADIDDDGVVSSEVITDIITRGSKKRTNESSQKTSSISTISFGDHLIHFGYNSTVISSRGLKQLDELADSLQSLRNDSSDHQTQFEIQGHTDNRGGDDYNYDLGMRRAESVKNYLIAKAPPLLNTLKIKSYGETKPVVASAQSEEEHAKNRRVELHASQFEPIESPRKGDLQVRFSAWLVHGDGAELKREQIISGKSVLYDNTRFQLHIQANRTCHVYIYLKGSDGEGKWLFPDDSRTLRNPLQSEQSYWLPSKSDSFQLGEREGEETIYLVASQVPAHDLTDLINNPTQSGNEEIIRIRIRGNGGVRRIHEEIDNKLDQTPQIPTKQDIYRLFSEAGEFFYEMKIQHQNKR